MSLVFQAIERIFATQVISIEDEQVLLNTTTISAMPEVEVVGVRNYIYDHQSAINRLYLLHYFWGKLEKKLGMLEPATQCFNNALVINPAHIESIRELGFLLAETGQLEKSLGYFSRITELTPTDWMAWNDGGSTLRGMNCIEESLGWMKKAFDVNPSSATIAANIALLAYELHDYPQAQTWLTQAFDIEENNPEALHTQAMLFASQGEHEKSYEYDLKALSVKPDYPQARLGLALTALMLGRWEEGFAGYEHRWAGSDKAETNKLPSIGRPQWLGQSVYPSSSIVILPEQGFGDMIQFSRLLPVLKARFHKVEWRVPLEMLRLMAFNFSQENLIVDNRMNTLDVRKIDYELPIMSLPFALSVLPDTIPKQEKYLAVPASEKQKFSHHFDQVEGLKVGIAWTGKATLGKQKLRMVSTELLSLLDYPDITFVSLQKFDRQEIVKPQLSKFIDCMDECHDFMDTASLIEHLDLVISVDTSVAHLAAALGKPTWLLNRLGSEWRWMHNQTTSPWYPSMTIYNQKTLNDWTDVLIEMRHQLSRFIQTH